MQIVSVAVIDLTRPVEQKGFKSVALLDFTSDMSTAVITDTSSLTSGTQLYNVATAFFGNGGSSLVVGGKIIGSSSDIGDYLAEVLATNDYYGVVAVVPKANQQEYFKEIKKFVEGNEKLAVLEINGTADEVITAYDSMNSDRVVLFANSKATQDGYASAVAGLCFPQQEGSITWGNKAVTGIPKSGYTLSDEQKLLDKNINYVTNVMGLTITQFGRTTSGSNADITRSKDFLKNRLAESLTSALVNSKKVPFTTQGLAVISSAMTQVGTQAVAQDMLASFQVVTPKLTEIPAIDKTNRVLRNLKFIGVLSGAIETIEVNLEIRV